ncbi:MAG: Rieske 2Fe-2S domain-containing protein [Proteobacteria bacterium]|nr:Rieske 2Fe-2S domain-containing protein [Pseudomonadota bacterium]HQR03057.1 Rieske 2Fe-2S domain-containing protein [Rhodocyclaceae bacterium]
MPLHDSTITAGPIPERYARGWHCLGPALKFKDGKPHTVDAFGTRLVVFQGEDGKLNALDAWCPHMGGDLSHGRIEGSTVVCPFHGWSFGPDGDLKNIPYCKRLPRKARVGKWHTDEINEGLFVWHDHDGGDPIPGQSLPRLEQCYSAEWSDVRWAQWTININNRELVDNIADFGHFDTVHGSPPVYFANLFEGHKASQLQVGTSERLSGTDPLLTVATYFGPACLFVEMSGAFGDHRIESLLLTCNTPITKNSFIINYGVAVKRVPGLTKAENQSLIDTYVRLAQEALTQDVEIWDNKRRIDNPVLCEMDGPIYQARKWYDQFFVPVSEVSEESTRVQTYEMDISGGSIRKPVIRHLR